MQTVTKKKKKLRGFSLRANYTEWATDRRLSAKLGPTFADRGVSRGQHDGFPRPYINLTVTINYSINNQQSCLRFWVWYKTQRPVILRFP
jgi:hypothetical protein